MNNKFFVINYSYL